MSAELQQKLDRVKVKMQMLLQRHQALKMRLQQALEENEQLRQALQKNEAENRRLSNENEYLKVVTTLAPDRSQVESTRAQLSELVREIDKCIIELNE